MSEAATSSPTAGSWPRTLLSGAQMLFVAFGALVLVPLLTGLDPSVALFTAGIGTLVFHGVTRKSVPVFLASSFAFIAPIQGSIANFGIPGTLGGLFAAGLVYVVISQFVRLKGTAWLHRLLPPVVVGPVIMVIGLSLGGTTGYAINPARDLGPRIMHALLPIPGKRDSDWGYSWIPVVGPCIGGLLAAGVYLALFV